MSVENIVDGILSATYLIPISIAFSLAANHGKYLPLWVPYTGLLGAYASYAAAEKMHLPVGLVLLVGITISSGVCLAIHQTFFRAHVKHKDAYGALLRALALTIFIEAALGWATGGYALSYNHLKIEWGIYLPGVAQSLSATDIFALISALAISPAIVFTLRRTWVGLEFRSVAANRDLARDFGLPVGRIDGLIFLIAGALSGIGAIMYGMKYDLSPQMFGDPTMKVAAVVVAFGAERLERVVFGILILGIVEVFVQSLPSAAPFASATGYVLLTGALLFKHGISQFRRRLV